MILILLLALFPIGAVAQVTFGPVRLDDSLAITHYYPSITVTNQDTLRCVWASQAGATVVARGRWIAPDGAFLGEQMVIDSAFGQFTCPPSVSFLPLSSGGELRLIHHS